MEITKTNLLNTFLKAKELGAKYVGVALKLPNAEGKEIIINSKENFDSKLEYYLSVYSEDLTHLKVPGLRIVGTTFGYDFESIEKDLITG